MLHTMWECQVNLTLLFHKHRDTHLFSAGIVYREDTQQILVVQDKYRVSKVIVFNGINDRVFPM